MSTRKFQVIHKNGEVTRFYSPSATSLKMALDNIDKPAAEILFLGYRDTENLPYLAHKENAAN